MTFSIADISSYARGQGGYSQATHFQVLFTLPTAVSSAYGPTGIQNLSMTASAVTVPGVNLETVNIRRNTIGYEESFPVSINFGKLNVVFLSDAKGESLQVFRDWIDYIYNNNVEKSPANQYLVKYKNKYTTTLQAVHYDPAKNKLINYQFFEAYPSSISDVNLSWAAFDTIVSLSVTFNFTRYIQQRAIIAQTASAPQRIGSQLQGQALNNLTAISPQVDPVNGLNAFVRSASNPLII